MCDSAIRKMYLTGHNSILNNLPCPKVDEYDNHSYVTIRSCIEDFLSSGKLPKKIKPNHNKDEMISCITESKRAYEIYNKAHQMYCENNSNEILVILGLLWSDDFDPNTSIKSNRGSVWIKTLTFVAENTRTNDERDAYPISMGLKSNNHERIERMFVSELNELSSGINNEFYSTALKRRVLVHFEIIVSLGDQPERRPLNYIMNGNSNYAGRYGYGCKIADLTKTLPFCLKCRNQMKQNNTNVTQKKCSRCLQWDILSNLSLSSTEIPKNYPVDILNKKKQDITSKN